MGYKHIYGVVSHAFYILFESGTGWLTQSSWSSSGYPANGPKVFDDIHFTNCKHNDIHCFSKPRRKISR